MLHPYLSANICKAYRMNLEEEKLQLVEKQIDLNGHGTACASVIKKECPDVDIISIQLLDTDGMCNFRQLELAMQYIERIDADLINLSLALKDRTDLSLLKKICARLNRQNKTIVVSLGNHMKKSYPAYFNECIGVRGAILDNPETLWFNKKKKIQCVVDSTPYLHCDLNNGYNMFGKCNSYAAAKITGILAREILPGHFSREACEKCLATLSARKHWTQWSTSKSRRFPDIYQYKGKTNERIVKEVEKYLKDITSCENIRDARLLSSEVGLQYQQCYCLIKELERIFSFKIVDYTKISREVFYSIYSLAFFIEGQLKERNEL